MTDKQVYASRQEAVTKRTVLLCNYLSAAHDKLMQSTLTNASPQERQEASRKGWMAWSLACEAASLLEPLMPSTSSDGYAMKEDLRQNLEGVGCETAKRPS